MTFDSETGTTRSTAQAGQTDFLFTFTIGSVDETFWEDVKNSLKVYGRKSEASEVLFVQGTDYSVDVEDSKVIFSTAREAEEEISIILDPTIKQLYPFNTGEILEADVLESAYDRVTRIARSLKDAVLRTLSVGTTFPPQEPLNLSGKAGFSLVVDETEKKFELEEIDDGSSEVILPAGLFRTEDSFRAGDILAYDRQDEAGNHVLVDTTVNFSRSTDPTAPKLTIADVKETAIELQSSSSDDVALINFRSPAKSMGLGMSKVYNNHRLIMEFNPTEEGLETGKTLIVKSKGELDSEGRKTLYLGTADSAPIDDGKVFLKGAQTTDGIVKFFGHGPTDKEEIQSSVVTLKDEELSGATFKDLTTKGVTKRKKEQLIPVAEVVVLDFEDGASDFSISLISDVTISFANVPSGTFLFKITLIEREGDNYTITWPANFEFGQGMPMGPFFDIGFTISYDVLKIVVDSVEKFIASPIAPEFDPGPPLVFGILDNQLEDQLVYFPTGSSLVVGNSTITLKDEVLSGAAFDDLRFDTIPTEPIEVITGDAVSFSPAEQNKSHTLTAVKTTITLNSIGVDPDYTYFSELELIAGTGAVVPTLSLPIGAVRFDNGVIEGIELDVGTRTIIRASFIPASPGREGTIYVIISPPYLPTPVVFKAPPATFNQFSERGHP